MCGKLIILVGLLAVVSGRSRALFGLGPNAVTRLSKVLTELTASDELEDNLEALKKREPSLVEKDAISHYLEALAEQPTNPDECHRYSSTLHEYRKALEETVGPNLLYSDRYGKYRAVKILMDYVPKYYTTCMASLQGACEAAQLGEVTHQETLELLRLFNYCSGGLLKKRRAEKVKQPLVALECALADYEKVLNTKSMESRVVEFGNLLSLFHEKKSGIKLPGSLEALDGEPELVDSLFRLYLLGPCKEFLATNRGRKLQFAVDIARGAPFSPEYYASIPDGINCFREMRKTMMCKMIVESYSQRLMKKIAGV